MDAPRLPIRPARQLCDPLRSPGGNRIDQLRLFAAVAVVFGHSGHIAYGREADVPFQEWTVIGFHSLAVYVFFFLSGLLVTESAVRHAGRPYSFMMKRLRRIVPALVVNAVLVPPLLVFAGAWTGVSSADIALYSLRLVSLFFVQYEDPGAFAGNPFAHALNGSVWSLRHEIIVYALLFGAILVGALRTAFRKAAFILAVAGLVTAGTAADAAKGGIYFLLAEGHLPMFAFLLGVVAHQFSDRIPLDVRLLMPGALLLAAFAATDGDWAELREFGTVALVCALTLFAAFPRKGGKRLRNDLSYGVYIYAWPIQQLVVFACLRAFGIPPAPLGVFVLTMPPLLLVAALSWKYVEEPMLRGRVAKPGRRAGKIARQTAT